MLITINVQYYFPTNEVKKAASSLVKAVTQNKWNIYETLLITLYDNKA